MTLWTRVGQALGMVTLAKIRKMQNRKAISLWMMRKMQNSFTFRTQMILSVAGWGLDVPREDYNGIIYWQRMYYFGYMISKISAIMIWKKWYLVILLVLLQVGMVIAEMTGLTLRNLMTLHFRMTMELI